MRDLLTRVCLLIAATGLIGAVAEGQAAFFCAKNRPFTAKRVESTVTQTDGAQLSRSGFAGTIARDSTGRTYSELRDILIEFSKSPINSGLGSGHFGYENHPTIHSTIWISDCEGEQQITIFPDLKVARIAQHSNAPGSREDGVSLFDHLTNGPRPQNVISEDLGFKEIAGVLTHGYRETVLGTEDDGAWNGRPTFVDESWISDDLAEVVLRTLKNFKSNTEITISLSDIARGEPNTSLFEIPAGFKIEAVAENTSRQR